MSLHTNNVGAPRAHRTVAGVSPKTLALSAERLAGRAPAARMLGRAITEHSSQQRVADKLGVSRNLICRWCDPADPLDATLRDILRMPTSVVLSVSQQMSAAVDERAAVSLEHRRQQTVLASLGADVVEVIERHLGVKIDRLPHDAACGGRR